MHNASLSAAAAEAITISNVTATAARAAVASATTMASTTGAVMTPNAHLINSSAFSTASYTVEHNSLSKASSDAAAFTPAQVAELKSIIGEAVATHVRPVVADAISA